MRTDENLTFTSHDGEALFYRHWKAVAPQVEQKAVIVFHRGHEHSGRVAHLVDELELPEYDFFAWDARGGGQSPGARGDAPSLGWMVKDAQFFFQHIQQKYGIKPENIVVIGQSVGAVIATTWVHDYVPKIRALILASPAFKVKLYVPFAIPGLRLLYNLRGNFFVNSYVKARFLTHDEKRRKTFNQDPLITRPISVNLLLDLFDTSKRIVADAAAIQVPTLLLISGSDYVVKRKPQKVFFNQLGAKVKEMHVLKGFYHDTLGEKDRALALSKIKKFIVDVFQQNIEIPSLLNADKVGYTATEAQTLGNREPNSLKRLNWWFNKKGLRYAANISDGIQLGMKTGFDSGSTLDYVYRNQVGGLTGFGRFLDFSYLQSIGWRGIRQRKNHLEQLLQKWIERQQSEKKEVHIVDIAAGYGRYVLETVDRLYKKPNSILLRDYSPLNIEKGTALIQQKGLSAIAKFECGDAFDEAALSQLSPRPTIGIVSGLYELFSDNTLLQRSLKGLANCIDSGGYLIYTNQPWHPQLEYIARVLTSHREGQEWIMRRRMQLEMDQLVEEAGFTKQEMLIDQWGIFTVSIAIRD